MLMIFPHFVTDAMGRYISGDIQLTYNNDERGSNSQIRSKSSLEQKYRLNYRRYWLSPRLLTYSLQGIYTQEDGEDDGASFESESYNYSISLDFLQQNGTPFSIYAYRHTQNNSNHLNTRTPTLEQTNTGLALRGSVKSRKYPTLRYWLTQDDRERTGAGYELDDRRRVLHLDLSKKWNNVNAELSYDYRNFLDRLTDSGTDSHTIDFLAESKHRLSRTTNLNLNASAGHETLNKTTFAGASAVLYYRPSSRLRGENGTTFTYSNDTDGTDIIVRNNTRAEYRISRNLLSNGEVTLLSKSGSSADSTSEIANGSLNYSASLPAKIRFSARTGAGYGAYQGDSGNSSRYNADISSGLSKSFRRIRSSLSTSANASYANSSDSDDTYQYQVEINGANNYIKRLQANVHGKYYVKSQGEFDDERRITGKGSLKYNIPLGWRATMTLNADAWIERGDISSEIYSAGQELTYIMLRNLFLKQSLYYWMAPVSDSTAISASVDINYRIRQTLFTVEYDRSIRDDMDISTTVNTLRVQASRRF